jgi:nicotinamide mononucleotide adenylyltransferase
MFGRTGLIAVALGADVALSMGEPGLWSPADLEVILGNYGAFIVERSGTDIHEALATLRQYEDNIWIVRFGNPSDLR